MGILEGLTNYWWNEGLFMRSWFNMCFCYTTNIWGLMFDNDNGWMFNKCSGVVGGSEVIFPV